MNDWTNEEEEAFNEVEKHSNLGKQILRDIEGQPYHFEAYVSPSQRNQVLEEAARVADAWSGHYQAQEIAKEIRSLKK